MPDPLRPSDVPILEGWVPLADAAERMKLSTNGLRKRVFDYNEFGTENVRRIIQGTHAVYLLRGETVDAAVEDELADREEFHAVRQPRIEARKAKAKQRAEIVDWAKKSGYEKRHGPIPVMGRLTNKLLEAYVKDTGNKLIE